MNLNTCSNCGFVHQKSDRRCPVCGAVIPTEEELEPNITVDRCKKKLPLFARGSFFLLNNIQFISSVWQSVLYI